MFGENFHRNKYAIVCSECTSIVWISSFSRARERDSRDQNMNEVYVPYIMHVVRLAWACHLCALRKDKTEEK